MLLMTVLIDQSEHTTFGDEHGCAAGRDDQGSALTEQSYGIKQREREDS